MSDRSFLNWPFFEPRHKALADDLDAWCAANLPVDHSDVDGACRGLVAALGDAGWLQHSGGDLDVRTLCLIRETLARHDGLADFAFAMQGLGTGAISLFGTEAQKQAWLPLTRTGQAISAFALTEPQSGSDVAPHPLATLTFTDCRVPASALLGERGKGFGIAMSVLDVFRSTVAAAALGFARRALDEALARVTSRQVQGAALAELQLVQGHIAEMALDVDASALLIYRAAWTKDSGASRVTREAAMAKLFATDQAQKVIDAAVQLHGGDGVRSGQMVESLYREIRALRIYEGASDVQKVVIARQTLANFAGEK